MKGSVKSQGSVAFKDAMMEGKRNVYLPNIPRSYNYSVTVKRGRDGVISEADGLRDDISVVKAGITVKCENHSGDESDASTISSSSVKAKSAVLNSKPPKSPEHRKLSSSQYHYARERRVGANGERSNY